jgi:hypothetical protein
MKKTKKNFEKDFRSSHAASTLFYSRSKQQQLLRATTGRKKETEAAGMMTSKNALFNIRCYDMANKEGDFQN